MDSLTLGSIAEVAIAITGFTAVASVIGTRSGGWDSQERASLIVLVRTSLAALFGSFIPEMVGEIVVDTQHVWRVSCVVFATLMLVDVLWAYLSLRAVTKPNLVQKMIVMTSICLCGLMFAAGAGAIAHARLLYMIALLLLLGIALLNFVEILISSTAQQPEQVLGKEESR